MNTVETRPHLGPVLSRPSPRRARRGSASGRCALALTSVLAAFSGIALGADGDASTDAFEGEQQSETSRKAPVAEAGKIVAVRDGSVRLRGIEGLRANDVLYAVKTEGGVSTLVAELVVRKMSSKRALALATIKTLRAGTTAEHLKGLAVITQRAARADLDRLQLGSVRASKARDGAPPVSPQIVNRNPTVALSFRAERMHARLVSGSLGLEPETTLSGFDIEAFAPALAGSEWLGVLGVTATILNAAPVTAQGRSATTAGTQDARIESLEETVRLVIRPVLPLRAISRVEVALAVSDRIVQDVTFTSGGESLGRTSITAKGLGLRLGIWSAPYDGIFLAMAWDMPITRRLSALQEDVGERREASGRYRRSDLDFWGALRWPPTEAPHAFGAIISAGATLRDERIYAAEVTGREERLFLDTIPWLTIGGHYTY